MPLRRPPFYGRAMRWRTWITIACAAAALAPATASAGFGPPVDVSAPTTNNVFPQVATDADGRSVVVQLAAAALLSAGDVSIGLALLPMLGLVVLGCARLVRTRSVRVPLARKAAVRLS